MSYLEGYDAVNYYAYKFIKRFLDIIVSFIGIILIVPIGFGVWIANIVNRDFGPLIYKGKRIGKDGKVFIMYKFRSMSVNSEKILEELISNDLNVKEEYLNNKKLENDPRVSKVGKFIRKISIDEFPQFINVFLGNMSIVGPRPYLEREKEDMKEAYDDIIKCKPGITGLWQVSGRNNLSFSKRLLLDKEYLSKRGLILDIKIFFKTIWIVLIGKGAK